MTANPDSSGLSPGPMENPPPAPDLAPAGDDAEWVDEALAPLREFISALCEVPAPLFDPATGEGLRVESIRIAMPFELDAEDADGRVRLGFEIAYGHAFRPAPRPRVQAEARVDLADLRAMVRAGRRPER